MGHLIGAWGLGKVWERKWPISKYGWFFLLLGGILPDADFLFDWILRLELHRTFSHSLLFVLFCGLLVYVLFRKKEYSWLIGLGVLSHLLLDMMWAPGVPILWPSMLHFSYSGITYFDPTAVSLFVASKEELAFRLKFAVFDMGLGAIWIFYLMWKKNLKF